MPSSGRKRNRRKFKFLVGYFAYEDRTPFGKRRAKRRERAASHAQLREERAAWTH